MPFRAPFRRRVYGAALYLYPPAFRREFGPEMLSDFDEALGERWCRRGRQALFFAHIATDLAVSVARQWWRSGLPLIAVVAASGTLLSLAALSRLWPVRRMELPLNPADRDLVGLILLAIVVILLIATTIVLTIWSTPIRRVPQRRR